jgi:hypothetical protein
VNGSKIELILISMFSEQCLQENAEAAMRHQEPTLLQLVTNYNALCETMTRLINQQRAVPGAVAPHLIPHQGIFDLNVDDDIWQDVGLMDNEVDPPSWLADEAVRSGIHHMLERDRCLEEEERLCRERCHIQEYLSLEWDTVFRLHQEYGELSNSCRIHY